MIRHWLSTLLVSAMMFGIATAAAAQPSYVSYQGAVIKNNAIYNGPADFKFAVVDGDGTTYLWSNDGSLGEPAVAISLNVDAGIFSVLLGKDMNPLVSTVFAGSTDPVLRVWVDTGEGFELLPDSPIASVPFALVTPSLTRNDAYAVGPFDFQPRNTPLGSWDRFPGGVYIGSGTDALWAPVHLPNGSRITEFEVFYEDSSVANDLSFVLGLQIADGGVGVGTIGSVTTSGSSGIGNDSEVLSYTIDNEMFHYFVSATGDSAWDANLIVHRVVIRYELP